MIQAEHLSKTYSIIDKEVGLKGSIKAFFKPKKKSIPAVQAHFLTGRKRKNHRLYRLQRF
ncbi:hypothetical protein SSU05_0259 [Streptococcus suis 05ZYH33]|nr:hypothetical protein SSU05_0259 [Streptococcus suis 05ZYH33]